MGEQSYYQVSFIGVAGEEDTARLPKLCCPGLAWQFDGAAGCGRDGKSNVKMNRNGAAVTRQRVLTAVCFS